MQKVKYDKSKKTLEKDYTGFEDKMDINEDIIMAFINVEKEDEENLDSKITKLVKNIKWFGNKNGCKNILLHSFAHLSSSKSNPDTAKNVLDKAEERLKNVGYQVSQTPFGYLLNIELFSEGKPLTRFFKEF
jgi:D-Tyr-tRNAtyr deacylase